MVAPLLIAAIPAMISMASSLMSSMRGASSNTAVDPNVRDAARTQQEYVNASVNPNHPWTKAMARMLSDELQKQAASGLSEEMRQRRRLLSTGRLTEGMDTSRRDEAQSGAISRAFMDASTIGMKQAMSSLGQAAGAQGNAFNALNQYSQQTQAGAETQRQNQTNLGQSGPFALMNMFNMFKGMFGGGDTTPGSYGGDTGRLSGVNPHTGQMIIGNGMQGGGV